MSLSITGLSWRGLTALALAGGLLGCNGKADTGGSQAPAAADSDGDGVADAEDCDPYNDQVYPGAPEVEDFLDNNCDGVADEGTDRVDDDGDGYNEYDGDCDDGDPGVSPNTEEIPYDGIDQDCDGADLVDVDGDGYAGSAGGAPEDCDDTLASVYPGADEWANGVDDNCNGLIDEHTDTYDDDGDSYSEADGDCDDSDAAINPDATEIAYDGIDQDCDFHDLRDADADGFEATEAGGSDCDDAASDIFPGAVEIPYDDIDQDCDGTDLVDVDGDGWLPSEGDCDDEDPDANPAAVEIADRIDNNCNGVVDEDTVYGDDDLDGYSEAEGDCDDANPEKYPSAPEIIDGLDNDCNDLIDEQNLDGAVEITGRAPSDYFGSTIDAGDINGDGVQDIAVGARYDDEGGSYTGQAWVVSGDTAGGVVTDIALFSVVGSRTSSYLGTTVEIVPDMDGDGDDELLVSAPNDYLTSSSRNEGFAYLIPGDSEGSYGLLETASDISTDVLRGGESNHNTPNDIAAGDWNGDGIGDFALSDDYFDLNQTYQGGVFVYDGAGGPGSWGVASLASSADTLILGAGRSDYFGSRLQAVPDIDGDGYDELMARSTNAYTAYLFDGDVALSGANLLATDAVASFRDVSAGGGYWAFAMTAGDFDGDGDNDIAITNYTGDGAVMLFENGGSGWAGAVSSSDAVASISGNADAFGYGAAAGDTKGNGRDELLVGTYNYSEISVSAGAVFTFDTEDMASLDASTHSDYGRLTIAGDAYDYWGYSLVFGDSWWAGGTYGSSSYNNGIVYLVPLED